jgi:hypothetical protein
MMQVSFNEYEYPMGVEVVAGEETNNFIKINQKAICLARAAALAQWYQSGAFVDCSSFLKEVSLPTGLSASSFSSASSSSAAAAAAAEGSDIAPARVLLLGLGAGFLHSWFLHLQPHTVVDSVDISAATVGVAQAEFGLDVLLCRLLDLKGPNGTIRIVREETGPGQSTCRSSVIVGDAIQYLKLMSGGDGRYTTSSPEARAGADVGDEGFEAGGEGSGEDLLKSQDRSTERDGETLSPLAGVREGYDLLVSDMFTAAGSTWDGVPGTGVCNLDMSIDQLVEVFGHAQSLLRVRTGMLALHLTFDSLFDRYTQALGAVFGEHQLVFLNVQVNDYIVVVGNDKFKRSIRPIDRRKNEKNVADTIRKSKTAEAAGQEKMLHPCEDPVGFSQWVLRFSQFSGYSKRFMQSQQYSLNCSRF